MTRKGQDQNEIVALRLVLLNLWLIALQLKYMNLPNQKIILSKVHDFFGSLPQQIIF